MKTIKFRLVKKRDKTWKIQLKAVIGWQDLDNVNPTSKENKNSFKKKSEALDHVKTLSPLKNRNVNYIQYPTIKYLE